MAKGRRYIVYASDTSSNAVASSEDSIACVLLMTEVLQLYVLRRALLASST